MLKMVKIHRERVKRADKNVKNRNLFEIMNFHEKSRNLHAKKAKIHSEKSQRHTENARKTVHFSKNPVQKSTKIN